MSVTEQLRALPHLVERTDHNVYLTPLYPVPWVDCDFERPGDDDLWTLGLVAHVHHMKVAA